MQANWTEKTSGHMHLFYLVSANRFYRARSKVSSSLSKYANLPGTHDKIVPIPLPFTCSIAELKSNSRPSISASSDIAQQVGPAPFDFNRRQMFSIPETCLAHGLSFGSTFHGIEAVN